MAELVLINDVAKCLCEVFAIMTAEEAQKAYKERLNLVNIRFRKGGIVEVVVHDLDEAAILSQIRTGRARVNKYLSKIGAAESELCEHCQRIEPTPRLLFTCSKWEHLHSNMRAAHGSRYSDLSYALGGYKDTAQDGELSKWKPDLKAVRATIEFVLATKRLDYVPSRDTQLSQTQDTEA
ncbi:hypothetical protein B0A49_10910 [Cryomyces minteri]|uniref:Reverse transcriptase zinc-binding domain-containing protein n=1 Tax=Cryomyces minteri TaxID=331657 RepID=A0A4U0VVJ8_9PEZI|nr:hypothetical protein B0A49_10910 [Cryomyces minteri]